MNSEQEPPKRNAPLWVKIFVPLHIIAITSWALPNAPSKYDGDPPKEKLAIKTDSPGVFASSAAEYLRSEFLIGNTKFVKDSPLKFYLLSTGFWQYWDMFAPNPSDTDLYGDAVITYADGAKRRYQYPRIYLMPIGQKFMKERWRKFFERAGTSSYAYTWPVFAQRVALMNFDDPRDPPIAVELHRHQMRIQPPGAPENHDYTDVVYYTYRVDVARLRKG
ncbi:MAG: hypothetical protein ACHQ50_03515 [Fimbriimonadales bacterium]